MKIKYYIVSIAIFLSFITNAQDQYNLLWAAIENLELEGKTRSASFRIDQISRLAKQENNQEQIIKSFLYKAKYKLLLEEEAATDVYQLLLSEIKTASFPTSNMLESILAKSLENYLDSNAYKIRNRTTIDTIISADYRTWDINTLHAQIHQHYQNSLKEVEELIKIKDTQFSEVLKFGDNDKKYRNTLFDLLANRAISFYNANYFSYNIKDNFLIQKDHYALPSIFITQRIDHQTGFSSIQNTLLLYQQIEKAHLEAKDSVSAVYAVLDRLAFLKNKKYEGNQLYFDALKNLQAHYTGTSGLPVLLHLARYYKNNMNLVSHPDYNEKALKICDQIIKMAPDSPIGIEAYKLKDHITNPSLSITTENFVLPNKKSRALVAYKDIDSMQVSFYKVPMTYQSIKDSYYDIDSLITDFTTHRIPVKKVIYQLPKNNYHLQQSTEIVLPALKSGKYLVIVRKNPQASFENDIYGINYIQSTSLALISSSSTTQNTYQVVNRDNGSPIKDATILLQDNRSESLYFKKLVTNTKGSASIHLEKKSHQLNTLVSKGTDSLYLETSIGQKYPRYSYRNDDLNEFEAKAILFTDRSIYRPGQKVYFKGVLTQRKKKKSTPVAGEYVTILLYDANGDEIKELRLKTNEFGSVHGEFTLPTDRLNGEFTIEMDEDYEEDSDFWENVDDFNVVEHIIRVEEYKRPRFEITFDKITETYTLNDSVKIKGNAKAFLGSAISNVAVNYTITREKLYNLPFNHEEKVITGKTATNEKGDFAIAFLATPDERATPSLRPVYTYHILAEITDINGETRNETQFVRIGYHTLQANILMDQYIANDKKDHKLFVNIQNLNGHPIRYKGTVSIYKLKYPNSVLRKRPWPVPDIQQIPEETFIDLFPNDSYTAIDDNLYDDTDLIATYQVNTEIDDNIILDNIKGWKGGKYLAKFDTKDHFGYDISAEQRFVVTNPNEKYLADNQLFLLNINDDLVNTKNLLQIELSTAAKSLFAAIKAYQKDEVIFSDMVEIIDGQYNIPIRLRQQKDPIDVQVSFVKHNCIWTDRRTYHFPKKTSNNELNIELETFRNKLQPGTDETWKLKIHGGEGNPVAAEVLASMYDMSLDTFTFHEWRTDLKIPSEESYHYNDLPHINTHTSFGNISIWIKNLKVKHYRPRNFTYNTMNMFGFHFTNPDRSHKNYLHTIKYHPRPAKPKIGKRLKASGGKITGMVTDGEGLPLPGVNIFIKGTTKGTETDFDGMFSIEANKNDLLIFSYIGFISSEIKVQNNQVLVVMREDASQLEEVIVVGYGSIKTKSMTASVSVITSEETDETYSQILQGKVAGISISSASGATGSGSTIRIRGYSSVKNDNKVLIIVDGVPFLKGQQSLNTLDIADLQVLKGATATALYGNKGANGVMIITTKKGLETLQKVVPRKNLKETAFFFPQLQTDKKGNVSFSFTSPEALTRWKFQALAYDKKLNTRLIHSEVITQKELSIVPNVPRFLREGDTITISAKIANLDTKKMNGLVSLTLTDEISQEDLKTLFMDNNDVQNFSIDARGNTSVSWKLHIPKSAQAIRYKIVAKSGKFSDGEESILPVLTNRMLVTESVPMWVHPGEQKTFGFPKMTDQPSATRQNHQITLEYTTNPVWFAIKSLPYLMEYPYECTEQTFARYYSNEIASHVLNSHPKIKEVFDNWKTNGQLVSHLEKNPELKNILLQETPWLRNAQNEKEQQARLAALFDLVKITTKQESILEKLQGMQDASGGFPWFSGGNVNPYITRHIVSGLGHLKKLKIETEHVYTSNVIAKKAIAYLDKKYLENYRHQLLHDSNYSFSRSDLHYFYARSFWVEKYPMDKQIDSIYRKYIPKEQKKWMQKGLFDKTMLALILQRNGDQQIATNILNTLKENAVLSKENGMYWKENQSGWYWYQSPIELQALIIEAFSEITGDTETINELKTWLIRNKQLQSWSTTKATTEAVYALLLRGSDWLSVTEGADISFGKQLDTKNLLPMTGSEAGTGYIKKQWNSDEITNTMEHITVQNKSDVPQYGGYYWQYFEDLDQITAPDEHKILIKKELFLKQSNSEGTHLKKITPKQQVAVGDLIAVRVELEVKNDFEFVHMKDMRASGLEPINVLSQYKYQDGLGYYESTKDAATNFFFDYLPKGVYVFEYDLRVNNKGDFSNGITTIQSMYAPEFSSHSEGVRVKVK